MGADLCLVWCREPSDLGTDDDEAAAKVRAAVLKMSREGLREYLECELESDLDDALHDKLEELGLADVGDMADDDLYAVEVELAGTSFVDAAMELRLYRRDVSSIQIDGACYAITGGMSWGDTPTDAYQYVSRLSWIDELLYAEPDPKIEEVELETIDDDALATEAKRRACAGLCLACGRPLDE